MKTPDLLHEPIPSILRRLAVPTSIGFIFNTLFNVVDTFYAGLISTQALAALSLSFPVFFIIIAIGAGISSGATALIGHSLGSGSESEARLYAIQTISFGAVHGLLIGVCGPVLAPLLFSSLGAHGVYLEMALSYMNVLFAGAVFFLGNYVLNAVLTATGNTRSFRNFLVAGFFINLALDPWFLFGGFGIPRLGIAGIAWATVAVQAMGNIYLMTQVKQTGLLAGCSWRSFLPQSHPYRDLARQGFPSSLNMLTVSLGIFVITWFISRYGNSAVAAYGIATRIEQMALLPVMGLNTATLTLVARNNGANLQERVQETVVTALKAGVGLMTIGTGAVFLFAGSLLMLFSSDPAVVAIGTTYLHIESFVFSAYVILYTSVSALQGLKRPQFALWIGIFRQVLLPLPVFYFLSEIMEWGLSGIWWGILTITWGAAIVALIFVRRTMRQITGSGAP